MAAITNSRGSALVVVLAVTSILFLGAMFLLKVARESILTAQSLMDKLNAQFVVESTVEVFKFLGSTGEFTSDKLKSAHGDDIGMVREIPLDGTVIKVGKNSRISAWDAGAKLRVWGCNPEQLARMYEILTGDDSKRAEIEDSLLDWFDTDDLQRLNGAESYYYRVERGYRYGPRNYNAPQCVEELSLIKGLNDPKIWPLMRKELLLMSGGPPNLNTIDKTMLRAVLGINDDTADYLLAMRKEKGQLSFLDVSSATGIPVTNLFDTCSLYSTGVISLTVETVYGGARESVSLLVNFRPDAEAPFKVLEASF